ncbi:hypothetical protein L249_1525 [Ophiocordyceps polyrhachis-furcata BCC 54312]|uniref:Uncharacterized protein n=1 Tax=Ophiocordyceps polyrhachis-furcata BCC 54312 TaxID=1330021 RepID=A0A367L446_9HYPO|nr:hypothetical protein L249_1525 [Ophiocordyceps polyrhachis-furcata BCC 54312]
MLAHGHESERRGGEEEDEEEAHATPSHANPATGWSGLWAFFVLFLFVVPGRRGGGGGGEGGGDEEG